MCQMCEEYEAELRRIEAARLVRAQEVPVEKAMPLAAGPAPKREGAR